MWSNFGSGKPGGSNANDFERMILNDQTRADGGGTSAEFALPEWVTQNDSGRRTASQVVSGAEQPPGGGRNSERRKEFAGYSEHGHAARFGTLPDSQACVSAIPGENARKRLLVLANLLEERIAEIVGIVRDAEAALLGDLDLGQPVRFSHRQTAQTDGIKQLKYGGVGADP